MGTPAPPTPTTKNIVQLAQATPDLSTLVAALVAGGLTGTLSGKGPFTVFAAVSGAWASTCSVKHDTAMSLDYYKNVKVSQSGCCDLCASDSRCRTAVYSPRGECHLHDAKDSARAFRKRGWMLMAVTPAPPTPTTSS